MTPALIAVMAQYNLTLPPNAAEWRVPLKETRGYITGITLGEVRLLCLDGIVGWFCHPDGSGVFLGHLQHFVETKEKKERKAATPKAGMLARSAVKQAVLDELKALLGI